MGRVLTNAKKIATFCKRSLTLAFQGSSQSNTKSGTLTSLEVFVSKTESLRGFQSFLGLLGDMEGFELCHLNLATFVIPLPSQALPKE